MSQALFAEPAKASDVLKYQVWPAAACVIMRLSRWVAWHVISQMSCPIRACQTPAQAHPYTHAHTFHTCIRNIWIYAHARTTDSRARRRMCWSGWTRGGRRSSIPTLVCAAGPAAASFTCPVTHTHTISLSETCILQFPLRLMPTHSRSSCAGG